MNNEKDEDYEEFEEFYDYSDANDHPLSELTVIEDNETSIMHNVIFVNQVKYDDGWYLALTELSTIDFIP